MIFVKRDILVEEFIDNMFLLESVSIDFKYSNTIYSLLIIYRPPNSNFLLSMEELKMLLHKISLRNKRYKIIMMGDLNIDISKESIKSVDDYKDVLADYGLINLITDYTREEIVRGKLVSSCIDHICSNIDPEYLLTMIVEIRLADHYATAL